MIGSLEQFEWLVTHKGNLIIQCYRHLNGEGSHYFDSFFFFVDKRQFIDQTRKARTTLQVYKKYTEEAEGQNKKGLENKNLPV